MRQNVSNLKSLLLTCVCVSTIFTTQKLFASTSAAEPDTVRTGRCTDQTRGFSPNLEEVAFLNEVEAVNRKASIVSGKNVIVVLGKTGAGKSTTIDWLDPRVKLRADEFGINLNPDQDPATACAIGGSHIASYTREAQIHEIDDLCFVDIPGFGDTAGSKQNILNAALIGAVLKNAHSIRFLIVGGAEEFRGRGAGTFKDTLSTLQRLYGDAYGQLAESNSVLLVTKSQQNATKNHVVRFLSDLGVLGAAWLGAHKVAYIPEPVRTESDSQGVTYQVVRNGQAEILRQLRSLSVLPIAPGSDPIQLNALTTAEDQRWLTERVTKNVQEQQEKLDHLKQSMDRFRVTDTEGAKRLPLAECDHVLEETQKLKDGCQKVFELWNLRLSDTSPFFQLLSRFFDQSSKEQVDALNRTFREYLLQKQTLIKNVRMTILERMVQTLMEQTSNAILYDQLLSLQADPNQQTEEILTKKLFDWHNFDHVLSNYQKTFKICLKEGVQKRIADNTVITTTSANDSDLHEKLHHELDAFLANDAKSGVQNFKESMTSYIKHLQATLATKRATREKQEAEKECQRVAAEARADAAEKERQRVAAEARADAAEKERQRVAAEAERQATLDREAKLKKERDKAEKKTQRENAYDLAQREKSDVFASASKLLVSDEDSERITKSGSQEERQRLAESNRIMPEVKKARQELANYYNTQGNSYMAGEWEFSVRLSVPFCKDMASNNQVWERAPQRNAAGYDTYSRKQRDD